MYDEQFHLLGSRPSCFTPGERAPGTHCLGGWVGPGIGLDDMNNRKILSLPGLELQPLRRPAHSQLLYQLHYSNSVKVCHDITKVWLTVRSCSVLFHHLTSLCWWISLLYWGIKLYKKLVLWEIFSVQYSHTFEYTLSLNIVFDTKSCVFFNLHIGGWKQGPLDTAAT
jgi:hypothetical protein